MGFFSRKIHKSVAADNVVEVTEVDGIRQLHLGSKTVQSGMLVASPLILVFNYSRALMYFLLFSENIKDLLMIGLGGGSVTKYMHGYCPGIKQTVVEINQQVIDIARSHFFMPDNDERLNVIKGDGLHYMENNPLSQDCLMIDGFDSDGIPDGFCTPDFFDMCYDVLKDNGIFLINLWGSDKNFDIYLQRIEQTFLGRVLVLPTGKPGNIIVFGFKDPVKLTEKKFRERALKLNHEHIIDFTEFLDKLHEHNGYQKLYSILETL
ncbi:MAG: polyamine aminopropyltransferase [Methylophilaceae bacterium]